jgi:hypothetical protein
MKKAIRTEYAEKGVEEYYKTHADVYENPHFPYIKSLLIQNQHRIDYTRVLDFSSGGGEVTIVLSELTLSNEGINHQKKDNRFLGCDPFTFKLYEKNTGYRCLPLSFEDIVKGRMTPSVQIPFSAIICSFGMHLCPEKLLYSLVYQLFMYSKNIIIITPHKRPQLEKLSGVELAFDDFVLTERGKKVFLKSYKLS